MKIGVDEITVNHYSSRIDEVIEVCCKSLIKTEDFMKEFWPKAFLHKNFNNQWFCTGCDCVFEDFVDEPNYKFCPQCGRKFIAQFDVEDC